MNLQEIEHLRCPYCCRDTDASEVMEYQGTNLELDLMDGVLICRGCYVAWGVQDGWVRLTREDRSAFSNRLKRGLESNAPKFHDWGMKIAGLSPCRMIDEAIDASQISQLSSTNGSVRILEIGVGSGGNLPSIYGASPEGAQVWGIDLSIGLLERCRRKVQAETELTGTRLLMADPHRMPFPDRLFDRVLYVGKMTDFREPEVVRREMLRVVKEDGMVFPA